MSACGNKHSHRKPAQRCGRTQAQISRWTVTPAWRKACNIDTDMDSGDEGTMKSPLRRQANCLCEGTPATKHNEKGKVELRACNRTKRSGHQHRPEAPSQRSCPSVLPCGWHRTCAHEQTQGMGDNKKRARRITSASEAEDKLRARTAGAASACKGAPKAQEANTRNTRLRLRSAITTRCDKNATHSCCTLQGSASMACGCGGRCKQQAAQRKASARQQRKRGDAKRHAKDNARKMDH